MYEKEKNVCNQNQDENLLSASFDYTWNRMMHMYATCRVESRKCATITPLDYSPSAYQWSGPLAHSTPKRGDNSSDEFLMIIQVLDLTAHNPETWNHHQTV